MPTSAIGDQESQWEQAQQQLRDLDDYVSGAVGRDELHEVEEEVFRRLQRLGRVMMERFVARSGTGYTPGRPPCTFRGEPLTYRGIETVNYLSIFGLIELPRAAYAQPEGGYEYPMDAQWNRPARKYSFMDRSLSRSTCGLSACPLIGDPRWHVPSWLGARQEISASLRRRESVSPEKRPWRHRTG